jgi:cytidylate kinase
MPVITISGELGSEARYIAEKVAQKLGYPLVDKKTIRSVLSEYGIVDFDAEADSVPGFWTRVDWRHEERREEMAEMLERVLLALARHGDMVILGRGGFAILGGLADVLRVRIQAPLPIRAKRVLEEQKISIPGQAEAVVRTSDKSQAAFTKWFRGARLEASKSYDLVIDTGKVDPELAIQWLVEEVEALKQRTVAGQLSTDSVQADPTLDSVVSKALERQGVYSY